MNIFFTCVWFYLQSVNERHSMQTRRFNERTYSTRRERGIPSPGTRI